MSVHIQQAFGPVIDKLRRIQALCTNPHWTSERRWRVEELAREAERGVEDGIKAVSDAVASLVKEN